ncbi:Bcr/CflA family multidrug efflux MFS transporter [Neptunomonas qingdaonensis]|uniref:Bcr/CflA family efflux transporter n=1 Tax=Neptunomonas qingdaonensis TaxID=1045558 RepID=A0A1I2PBP5_9GAMM|nr:Bcr/CflA family multidrug efflux MFS transporter [Neptunomonas qingdaonensis]SFG12910.1 MFS transporter, DHA1 family, bicyclomycin/chloramphenicol resistance protein [Neptunomonas qingdaonensis]
MFLPTSLATILILASVVALGPLSTDMYLPALPRLTTELNASIDQVQITLSIFFGGFAVAQLLYGPLADRFGRKSVLLGGLFLFTAASFGCATATTIEELILFRFLQALGACGGPVLGRTMIRDIYGPTQSARVLSMMGTIMALAPAVAPIVGGYMLLVFNWSAIFIFLGVYGAIVTLIIMFKVQESLQPENISSLHPMSILRNYNQLLHSRIFLGYTLCCSFIFSGLFSFLSGSSFVLIDFFGVPEANYGFYFTAVVLGYMSGAQFSQRFGSRFGINKILIIGTSFATVSGSAMLLASLLEIHNLYWVIGCQVFFMMAVGMVMPQTMAGAMGPFSKMAGTASALLGFTQSGIAAIVGLIVGHNHSGTPTVMAASISLMGILSLASYWLIIRPATTEAESTLGKLTDKELS